MFDVEMRDEKNGVKTELEELIGERDDIVKEVSSLNDVLVANNIGMGDPLIDKEGFPRNDINVYEVRHARAKLIKVQNDYKFAMEKFESALAQYHSQDLPEFHDKNGRPPSLAVSDFKPLAKISKVEKSSPSEYAGLQEGDLIVEFGSVHSGNMKNLRDISTEMSKSVNSYLKIVVLRNGILKRVNLKPKKWEGDGYLGCMLLPV